MSFWRFFYDARGELGFSVPRDINDDGAYLRGKLFWAVAVTVVVKLVGNFLVAVVAEKAIHHGSHRRFDQMIIAS